MVRGREMRNKRLEWFGVENHRVRNKRSKAVVGEYTERCRVRNKR